MEFEGPLSRVVKASCTGRTAIQCEVTVVAPDKTRGLIADSLDLYFE